MKIKSKRYYGFSGISNYYFYEHKQFLIGFIGIFLVGAVIGVFSYLKFNKILDIMVLSQDSTENLLFVKVNIFSFTFSNFFRYLLNIIVILLLTITIYTIPFTFIYIAYLGYTLGAGIVVIVSSLSFGGIIGLLLFYLPSRLLIYFIIINMSCVCQKKCFGNFKFGRRFKCDASFGFNLKAFLLCALAIFVLCLLEALLMPGTMKSVLNSM